MYHINLANYIEEHKIDVKLTGTKRFSDKSGDYYLKNIMFQKRAGSPNKILPKLSLKSPESLNACIKKCKDVKTLEPHAKSLTARLPHDALTPIPIIEKTKVSSKFASAELSNAERYAVHIRRLEYSKGIMKTKQVKKEDIIRLGKVTFIQKWWKAIFAIKRIQRYFRGWNYRKRLYSFLKSQEFLIETLLEFEYKLNCYNMKCFLKKMKHKAGRQKIINIIQHNSRRLLKTAYTKWNINARNIAARQLLKSTNGIEKKKEMNNKILDMLFSKLNNENKEKKNNSSHNHNVWSNSILIKHSSTSKIESEDNNMKELFSLCKKFTVWKCKSSGRYVTLLNALVHFKKKKNDKVSRGVNNLIEILRDKLKESLLKVSVYKSKENKDKRILMLYEYKSHSANHSKKASINKQIYSTQHLRRANTFNPIKHDSIPKSINKLTKVYKYHWFNPLKTLFDSNNELSTNKQVLKSTKKHSSQLKEEGMNNKKNHETMNDLLVSSAISIMDKGKRNKGRGEDDQDFVTLTFKNEQDKDNNQQDKESLLNKISSVFQNINDHNKTNSIKDNERTINKSSKDKYDDNLHEDNFKGERDKQNKIRKESNELNDNEELKDHNKETQHKQLLNKHKQLINKETETEDAKGEIKASKSIKEEDADLLKQKNIIRAKNELVICKSAQKRTDIDEKKNKLIKHNQDNDEKHIGKEINVFDQSNKEIKNILHTDYDLFDENSPSFTNNETKEKNNKQFSDQPKSIEGNPNQKKIIYDNKNNEINCRNQKRQSLISQKHSNNNIKESNIKEDNRNISEDQDSEHSEHINSNKNSLNNSGTNNLNYNERNNSTPLNTNSETNLRELIQKMKQSGNKNKQINPNVEHKQSSNINQSSFQTNKTKDLNDIVLTSNQIKTIHPIQLNSSQRMKRKELKRTKSDLYSKKDRFGVSPCQSIKVISRSRDISQDEGNRIMKEYDNYIQPDFNKHIQNLLNSNEHNPKSNQHNIESSNQRKNKNKENNENETNAIVCNDDDNNEKVIESNSEENVMMGTAIKTIMNKALDTDSKISSQSIYYPIINNNQASTKKPSSILMVEEEQSPIETQTIKSNQYLSLFPKLSGMIFQTMIYKKMNHLNNTIIKYKNPFSYQYYFNKWNRKRTKFNQLFIPQLIQTKLNLFKVSKSICDLVHLFIIFNQWKLNSIQIDYSQQIEIETEPNNSLPRFTKLSYYIAQAKAFAIKVFIMQIQIISRSKVMFTRWKDKMIKALITKRFKRFSKQYYFVKTFEYMLHKQTPRQKLLINYLFKWRYYPSNIYCVYAINKIIKKVIVSQRIIKHYQTIDRLLKLNAIKRWKWQSRTHFDNTQLNALKSFKQIHLSNLAKNFHLIRLYSKYNHCTNKERAGFRLKNAKIKINLLYNLLIRRNNERLNVMRYYFVIWSKNKTIRQNKLKSIKKTQTCGYILKNGKEIILKRIQRYFMKWIGATLHSIKEHILLNTIISYQKTKDEMVKGRNIICALIMRNKIRYWKILAVLKKRLLICLIRVVKTNSSKYLLQILMKNKSLNLIESYFNLWKKEVSYCVLRASLIYSQKTKKYIKSITKLYSKYHLNCFIFKWHKVLEHYVLKENKLQHYLLKNNRLLLIEHLFSVWKMKSFYSKKEHFYTHLIKSLSLFRKHATKPQQAIRLFFTKVKHLNKRNKLLRKLIQKQYHTIISYTFNIWKKEANSLKLISHIRRLGKLYMKRVLVNNLRFFGQVINKNSLISRATQIIKHYTFRKYFGREARNKIKAKLLSSIFNHIYESKLFLKWKHTIIIQKHNRISPLIHYLDKTNKLKALRKIRYYSLKNSIMKSTTLLLGTLSKYPFSVLKEYLKSLHDKEFNQDLCSHSKKDFIYLDSIKRLKNQTNVDESKENTPKKSTVTNKKIKKKKEPGIKKDTLKETINDDIPKEKGKEKKISNERISMIKKKSNKINANAFDKYHDWHSLANSNYELQETNEEIEKPESNELNNLLENKQLKTFNYDILSSNDVIDKNTNNRASESLKSYTDYLLQLSNQLDNYQQKDTINSNKNGGSNSNNQFKSEIPKSIVNKSPIKKVIRKSSKGVALLKEKILINVNKKYLLNLGNTATQFKHFSNLCYLIKITFLQKNYKKLALFKKLIRRWRQIPQKLKLGSKSNNIVYKSMNKLHLKDTEEILGNNPISYQSQIKKSLNNLISIQEDNTGMISSKKGLFKKE